jgi:DNA-binding transcriptional MerR regulator
MPESQASDSPSNLLTPGKAAAILGVTTTTLAAWAEAGIVESIRLPLGHRRYDRESIEALAARRSA